MAQPKPPPRASFSDVDAQPDPQGYLRMLDLRHADPFKQRLKGRCRELLEQIDQDWGGSTCV